MEPISWSTSPAFLLGASRGQSGILTLEFDLILMVPAASLAKGIPDSLSKLEFLFSWKKTRYF